MCINLFVQRTIFKGSWKVPLQVKKLILFTVEFEINPIFFKNISVYAKDHVAIGIYLQSNEHEQE